MQLILLLIASVAVASTLVLVVAVVDARRAATFLRARNQRIRDHIAVLEDHNQKMLLKLGLLGYVVETIPAVPAKPAKAVIKQVKK